MNNKKFTIKKRIDSFKYAFNGVKILFKEEPNARIHCFIGTCVIIAGIAFDISRTEWISIIIVIGMVLAAEAFNSAIESLSDLVCKEYSDSIKKTKDLAAGAVLITAIAAACVGIVIFGSKILI